MHTELLDISFLAHTLVFKLVGSCKKRREDDANSVRGGLHALCCAYWKTPAAHIPEISACVRDFGKSCENGPEQTVSKLNMLYWIWAERARPEEGAPLGARENSPGFASLTPGYFLPARWTS